MLSSPFSFLLPHSSGHTLRILILAPSSSLSSWFTFSKCAAIPSSSKKFTFSNVQVNKNKREWKIIHSSMLFEVQSIGNE